MNKVLSVASQPPPQITLVTFLLPELQAHWLPLTCSCLQSPYPVCSLLGTLFLILNLPVSYLALLLCTLAQVSLPKDFS